MAISVETLALAKKYTDKTIVSKGDAGAAVIPDNFIGASKLTEDLRKAIDAAGVHIDGAVTSEDGAHALRYFNNQFMNFTIYFAKFQHFNIIKILKHKNTPQHFCRRVLATIAKSIFLQE